MPDDCEELTTLRAFRDGWLRARSGGLEAIQEYYRIAPKIVAGIRSDENAKTILQQIYDDMVLPCVRLIKAEKTQEAFELYRDYTACLANIFLQKA